MHVARGRASGGADAADHLPAGHLLAHLHIDLRQVVVGGGEALAATVGVPDDDPIAVAAGPACVHDRPFEGCPGRVAAGLPEVDAVVPALPVGERVGAIAEARGRSVVGDGPADEVTVGSDGGFGRDHTHRVGDQVAILDEACHQGRHPHRRGHGRDGCAARATGQGSDGLWQDDVGQRPADHCESEDHQDPPTEPASVMTPGRSQGMARQDCVARNECTARGGDLPGA